MTRTIRLTSDCAACCWIPLFPLRCETARQPELASLPVALVGPDDTRRVWQVSPLARHAGVKPGMTVSQAIGLCPALKLCEPDPVHYDAQFSRLLAALGQVSPVIEPAELGRAYVGTDGLEGLYGAPEEIVEAIKRGSRNAERGTDGEGPLACSAFRLPRSAFRVGWGRGKFVSWVAATRARPGQAVIVRPGGEGESLACSAFRLPRSAFRVGWGRGKFVSWVAATRARPGQAVIVRPGEEGKFLASQPLSVLALDTDTHRRLRQLGVRTLGALAALPEEAVVSQFGRAGRRLWRLAAGRITEPVVGRVAPAPIVAALTFFSPVAGRALLELALDHLIARALKDPRRGGGRVQVIRARAEREQGAPPNYLYARAPSWSRAGRG